MYGITQDELQELLEVFKAGWDVQCFKDGGGVNTIFKPRRDTRVKR